VAAAAVATGAGAAAAAYKVGRGDVPFVLVLGGVSHKKSEGRGGAHRRRHLPVVTLVRPARRRRRLGSLSPHCRWAVVEVWCVVVVGVAVVAALSLAA